ncbi:MAG: OmpH family outer membrane protein [Desulfovibrionaceae bacterium]|nr:OmpH family outer membrane protein [Desulfovibrionaceae bacterium]
MFKSAVSLVLFGALALSAPFASAAPAELKIAVVDVQKVLSSGPHAVKAKEQLDMAQKTIQGNLDSVQEKIKNYKDKAQAEAILRDAHRQLQGRFDAFRAQVARAMSDTLNALLARKTSAYDFVLPKSGVLANKGSYDITAVVQDEFNKASVTWPAQPEKLEKIELPADNGAQPAKSGSRKKDR